MIVVKELKRDGLLITRDPAYRPPSPYCRPMFELMPLTFGGNPYRFRASDLDDPDVSVR